MEHAPDPSEEKVMAILPSGTNPVCDLLYDWLAVLRAKAEGLTAYDTYIADAEKERSPECVELLRELKRQDAEQVTEIKKHLARILPGHLGHGAP